MRQALTNSEKNTYRAHPQVSNYYIACHQPRLIWSGALSDVPTSFPASALVANGTASGNLSDAMAGMTLRIGTEVGKQDLGRMRLRKAPSGSTIATGEFGSGIVGWQSPTYLSIVEEFYPWSIHPGYSTATSAWLVDLEPYSNQTGASWGPLALMGPPCVVDLGADGKATASFVGDRSYGFSGSITSQSWQFTNGVTVSSALGSSLTPIIISYNNASSGGRYNHLTVTDSAGASHIAHRLVFAFNASNAQPARVFIEEIAGGLNSGGYDGRIEVYGSATSSNFPDGAQIVIFERASYNGIASSLGGNAFGRNNIVLVGWIVDDSTRIEPFTGAVSFRIATIDRILSMTDAYDMFLESGSAASAWDMASGLTIDKAALALVKYRSTIGNIADFNFAGDTASAQELAFRSLPQSSLWEQLRYNYEGVLGLLASDMQSSIYATLDKQVTGASGTLPIITDIADGDRRDRVTLDHEHFDTNSQQVIYAVQGGVHTPMGGISPSHRTAHFGGRQEVARNLTAPNTDTAITWAGNYRAKQNNPYKRVNIPLSGNLRLDPVPQSRITMSLSPTGATNLRGINWNNQSLIPTDIRVAYNSQSRMPEIDITAETTVDGHGGSSIDFPPSITPLPTPTPVISPPPGGAGGGDATRVVVVTNSRIGMTNNFKDNSPVWKNVTGIITGTIRDFILDPYNPAERAFCITDSAIFRTTNLSTAYLQGIAPNWTSVYSAPANRVFRRISATIAIQNRIYVMGHSTTGTRTRFVYVTSNGTSWTENNTGATQTSLDSRGTNAFAVGQHNGDILYVSGGGVSNYYIRRSINGGTDWNTYIGTSDTTGDAAPDIHCPYAGNDDDSGLYLWANKQDRQLYRYTTSGGAVTLGRTEADVEASAGGQLRILVSTLSGNSIYILETLAGGTFNLLRSEDGGTTWNVRSSGLQSSTRALGAWPYDFNQVFLLQPSQPSLSIDGGSNFLNKTGNWTVAMGEAFADANEKIVIVPIWTI